MREFCCTDRQLGSPLYFSLSEFAERDSEPQRLQPLSDGTERFLPRPRKCKKRDWVSPVPPLMEQNLSKLRRFKWILPELVVVIFGGSSLELYRS